MQVGTSSGGESSTSADKQAPLPLSLPLQTPQPYVASADPQHSDEPTHVRYSNIKPPDTCTRMHTHTRTHTHTHTHTLHANAASCMFSKDYRITFALLTSRQARCAKCLEQMLLRSQSISVLRKR